MGNTHGDDGTGDEKQRGGRHTRVVSPPDATADSIGGDNDVVRN